MDGIASTIPLPLEFAALRSLPGARSLDLDADVPLDVREPGGRAGLVVSGALATFAVAAAGRQGVLEVLGPGAAFGVEGIVEGSPRWTPHPAVELGGAAQELRTLWRSSVVLVPGHAVAERLRSDPRLALELLTAETARRRWLERTLARQLCLPLPERLLALLEDLARTFGRPTAWGRRVRLPLPQERLAWMVGSTRESANRALRSLESEARLLRRGRTYVLPERPVADDLGRRDAGALR